MQTAKQNVEVLKTLKIHIGIDKNQSDTIDYGTRKIKIYPDNKEDIVKYITQSGMNLMKVFETDFAFVFIAEMKQNNS